MANLNETTTGRYDLSGSEIDRDLSTLLRSSGGIKPINSRVAARPIRVADCACKAFHLRRKPNLVVAEIAELIWPSVCQIRALHYLILAELALIRRG